MTSVIIHLSVAEYATLTQLFCKIYDNYKELLANAELDAHFEKAGGIATDLVIAIKRVSESAGLDKANDKRNLTLRNMFTIIEAARVSLIEEEAAAAVDVLAVMNRYGRKIMQEKQLEESAHIDSLLNDFATDEMKAKLAKIHCGAEYVAALSEDEAAYKVAQVASNRVKLQSKTEKSATAIKKELREFLNGTLLPYITALYTLEKDKYAKFYGEIEKEVKNANDSARKSLKSSKENKEETSPAEQTPQQQ